ncbi:MAG TPA: hypothetical protein VGE57_04665 [Solimonas sp.]
MRPDPRYLLGISILISGWSSGALASEPRCAISQNGQWLPQTEAQSLENCAAALKQRSEQTTGVLFARWNENLIGYDGTVFYVSQNNGETWTPTALRTHSTLIASANADVAPEPPPAASPEPAAPVAEQAPASHAASTLAEAAPVVTASAPPTAPPAAQTPPKPTPSAPKPAAVKPAQSIAAQPAAPTAAPVADAGPELLGDSNPPTDEAVPSLASVLASLPEPAEEAEKAEPKAAAPASEKPAAAKPAAALSAAPRAKPSVTPSAPVAATATAAQPAPLPPPAPPKPLPGLPSVEGSAPIFPGLPSDIASIGTGSGKAEPCLIWNGSWIRSTAPDLRACADLLDQSPENYDEGGYKYAYWSHTYLVATRQFVKSLAKDGITWADVRKRYRY